MLQNSVKYRDTSKGSGKIVCAILIIHRGATQHSFSELAQHILRQIHGIFIISISPVEFQHGKLRVVTCRKPFIAKTTINFENAFEPTHHQALQIKLRRNPQVHIHIERIVVRNKGFSRRSPRDNMHHRGLDFHKIKTAHVIANKRDDVRTHTKYLT